MKSNIVGVYLAAGNSSRFGSDKLAHLVKGKPLGAHALTTAIDSDLPTVLVITKDTATSWFTSFSHHKKCEQIICRKSHLGQAESIKCGLDEADVRHAEAMIVFLADQPFITTKMINKLMHIYQTNPDTSFVAMQHNGIICPPILFTRQLFPDLYQLGGDQGAKQLLHETASEGIVIPMDDKWPFYDIDTKEDDEYVAEQALKGQL